MTRSFGWAWLCAAASALDVERPGPAAHCRRAASFLSDRRVVWIDALRVLRHEESPAPCPITCNGRFATPWSKTMVGTMREDEAYALEVTFNYGVDSYPRGQGLRRFEMQSENVSKALAEAKRLGYAVDGAVVTGPDGYAYALSDGAGAAFSGVALGAVDVEATARWYTETLGMRVETAGLKRVLSFPGDSISFTLEPAAALRVEQWDGRNAFSLPAARVRAIYVKLAATQPERVVHELQEIDEKTGLGVLLIAIVSDPSGLELCLVSSEAFEPAIHAAADFVGPDYAKRDWYLEELKREFAANAANEAVEAAASIFGGLEL